MSVSDETYTALVDDLQTFVDNGSANSTREQIEKLKSFLAFFDGSDKEYEPYFINPISRQHFNSLMQRVVTDVHTLVNALRLKQETDWLPSISDEDILKFTLTMTVIREGMLTLNFMFYNHLLNDTGDILSEASIELQLDINDKIQDIDEDTAAIIMKALCASVEGDLDRALEKFERAQYFKRITSALDSIDPIQEVTMMDFQAKTVNRRFAREMGENASVVDPVKVPSSDICKLCARSLGNDYAIVNRCYHFYCMICIKSSFDPKCKAYCKVHECRKTVKFWIRTNNYLAAKQIEFAT